MSVWFPYTQLKTAEPNLSIETGQGEYLITQNGDQLIDGIASWWCAIHGYNHPRLNMAITEQLSKISHVMLGGLTHDPVEKLAKKLVEITPNGLSHVFFSDSGSVGVEAALKMAWQFWKNQNNSHKKSFISLQHSYHGDTLGAMSVSDPEESMHSVFSDLFPKHHFITSPSENTDQALTQLEKTLQDHHETIAGFILEPLVQGAGGLKFYTPEFLKEAQQICSNYNCLTIYDEVATGFGRTGTLFAANQADTTPDIMVLGKGLTGGMIGHAATLATNKVFDSFWSDDPQKAFMHGPTFMGNPLACAVALESISIFESENYLKKIKNIESILNNELMGFNHPSIKEIRVKGAIGVIEVYNPEKLKEIQNQAIKQGLWVRPFGNIIYLMPPYIISEENLSKAIYILKNCFTS